MAVFVVRVPDVVDALLPDVGDISPILVGLVAGSGRICPSCATLVAECLDGVAPLAYRCGAGCDPGLLEKLVERMRRRPGPV